MRQFIFPLFLLTASCWNVHHAPDGEPPRGAAAQALSSPSGSGFPGSMSRLVVNGYDGNGASISEHCHAVLITPRAALTAAHCFSDFWPFREGDVTLFGQSIQLGGAGEPAWTDRVRLHPDSTSQQPWSQPFSSVNTAHDLAVVHLSSPAAGAKPSKLFRPVAAVQGPLAPLDWPGVEVLLGGHADGETLDAFGQAAHGVQVLAQLTWADPCPATGCVDGDAYLDGTGGPTGLQAGDSGGGAFIISAEAFGDEPAAAPLDHTVPCSAVAVAGPSDWALVGIASKGGSYDTWTPTFVESNFRWLTEVTNLDEDGDERCDERDNCPSTPNNQSDMDGDGKGDVCDPDVDGDSIVDESDNCPYVSNTYQENCNALAERLHFGGSNGTLLGDACDPVPCATPSTLTRQFVPHSETWSHPSGNVCNHRHGRSIQSIVSYRPMRAAGVDPLATANLRVWFCPCETASAEDCQAPPWSCILSPGAWNQPGSRWLPISLTNVNLGETVPQPLSTVYQPWAQSSQPRDDYGWDYWADYDDWVTNQHIWAPTQHDASVYGPGTDMRGLLWIDDPTVEGGAVHGACSGDGCSLSSSYLADVQPDRAETLTWCKSLPVRAPAPWWSYCGRCADWLRLPYQSDINPDFVTVVGKEAVLWTDRRDEVEGWPRGAGVDVTAAFSRELLGALGSSDLVWVGPSAPDTSWRPGLALAFALSVDATQLVGRLEVTPEGFSLQATPMRTGMSARRGFASAYSMATRAMVVLGGSIRGFGLSEMWSYGPTGIWTKQGLSSPPAVDAETAVISQQHVWIVDREQGGRVLKHVDLLTGIVTTQRLNQLAGVEHAWLLSFESGEVVLVTARAGQYEVMLLVKDMGALLPKGIRQGNGIIAMPPGVRGTALSLPVLMTNSDATWIEPTPIALAELL